MSLIELYESLICPEPGNGKILIAIRIPDNSHFRVARNSDCYPVLLFSNNCNLREKGLKNFRFEYLQLEQGIECKITENGESSFQKFTVITFRSEDKNLQYYFLRIAETLVKSLSENTTQQQLVESFNNFVEVFRSLSDTPTNTIQGLWSELFLIESSKDPQSLLDYWHTIPEEKFDFNSGSEKIEVKSSSTFERLHTFSTKQLNPSGDSQVLIASIFVRQHSNGNAIGQLIDSISTKINYDPILLNKLFGIVFKTLGSSMEQSIIIKFDYNIAKESLRFYKHQDISKIDEIYIPNEVTDVHFKSDLSEIKPIEPRSVKKYGNLFKAL